jgi:quinoprotein glucose dehydrogenase
VALGTIALSIALLGLALASFGLTLALAGGSWFYVALGLGVLASGVALVRRRQNGLRIYALVLAATFVWTLGEVGLDKWQWIPRGALILLVGFVLCLPFVVRRLRDAPERPWKLSLRNGPLVLRAVVLLIAALSAAAWFVDPVETRGRLPKVAAAGPAAVDPSGVPFPADDWVAYGGTNLGQRYSALADITPGTVRGLTVAWEHHTGDLRGDSRTDSKEFTF